MSVNDSSAIASPTPRQMTELADQTVRGERWTFSARAPEASKVFLVHQPDELSSTWHLMEATTTDPGQWTLQAALPPGRHRFRYFAEFDGTVLNCGTAGLTGRRLSNPDPRVQLDPPFDPAA